MSSTNKTTKLGLSQFLGTDKPAWLGDYNSDMQKIDDAFANLEQDGQSSAADIAALQQKDDELTQDIADVNERVDAVAGDIISVGNRTTVLEGNYDTMHHELVLTNETVEENKADLAELDNRTKHAITVFVDAINGDDANDGLSAGKPMKTLSAAHSKYYLGLLTFSLANGEYLMPKEWRSTTTTVIAKQAGTTPTLVFGEGTYLFNSLLMSGINVAIRGEVVIYASDLKCNSDINVESGKLTFSECNLSLNDKTISGTALRVSKCCMFLHGSTSSVTTATATFSNSIVMDGAGSITSAVTNDKSLIYSQLTI